MPKKAKNKEEKKAYRTGYVALIGRPNVGKSTLLNRLLGQKVAIVSDKPQTTRISILGIKTTERGQIIFIDNPGIHKPLHTLNKRMMNFVYSSLETADVLCLLIDATEKFGHGDEFVIDTLEKVTTPIFLLINKVDAVRKDRVLPLIDKYKDLRDFKEIIPVSALKGDNLDVLEKLIFERLPDAEKLYSDEEISDQSEVFLLAEIIREKILDHVKEELPFVTAVYIEEITRRKEQAEDGKQNEEDPGAQPGPPAEERHGPHPGRENGDISPKAVREPINAEPVSSAKSNENTAETQKDGGREAGRRETNIRRPVTYIRASIFVEKDNHRKIIIGRQGKLIKMIGIEARREIEEILESKVFLELHVRVKPRWRDSEDVLDLIEGQKG